MKGQFMHNWNVENYGGEPLEVGVPIPENESVLCSID
jgi:hypothetical protein